MSKRLWGSGLDTLLTHLRTAIRETGDAEFPAERLREIMADRGKSLAFDDREIDTLLELEYGKPSTFLALSLMYPFIDLRNQYHVDHIYPTALLKLSALAKQDLPDEDISWVSARRNRLPNLQLLDGAENNEKQKTLPADWLNLRFPTAVEKEQYCRAHDIGREVSGGIPAFGEFYKERRTRMRTRLLEVLNG